jgi:hypothetical protein
MELIAIIESYHRLNIRAFLLTGNVIVARKKEENGREAGRDACFMFDEADLKLSSSR